ncbi:MAG: thiol protease/hemagglutinin PrtT [Bacteroidales bacterium]|nr:thiol protease/hemagglutinin PrtT [Bacteroidales bacterium]
MKKMALAIMAMTLAAGVACAARVDRASAARAAVNFWNTYRPRDVQAVQSLQPMQFDELRHQYVFANGESGFVIISAEDAVRPVLGYSFDTPFPQQLHSEVAWWLGVYESQLAQWADVQAQPNPAWKQLLDNPVPEVPLSAVYVPYLVQTQWDQDSPFNIKCPYDNTYKDRTVVGCVATAMSQIMKYWNHPYSGTGSHSYEPYSMWGSSSYGTLSADFEHTTYKWWAMLPSGKYMIDSESRDAVSTLCYHVGVAVEMMYGTSSAGGSGAYSSCGGYATACASSAFTTYFKYDPATLEYRYRSTMSDDEWRSLIDQNLAKKQPIYYDGSDKDGGHAFVLDGSNTDTTYHFNWGWGGYADGYFYIDNLAPQGSGTGGNATNTYNYNQGAIFGIKPLPEVFDTISFDVELCAGESFKIYDFSVAAANVDTFLHHLDTVVSLHIKKRDIDHALFNSNVGSIGKNIVVDYCSLRGVVAPECTFVREGRHFSGWGDKKAAPEKVYLPGDTIAASGSPMFYAVWVDSSKLDIVELSDGESAVWPNPANSVVNVSLPQGSGHVQAQVVDAVGRVLISVNLVGQSGQIDVSQLPNGVYLLTLSSDGDIRKHRIIKQ